MIEHRETPPSRSSFRIATHAVLAAGCLLLALPGPSRSVPTEWPVELVSTRIVLVEGEAFVPLVDLARALGGTVRFTEAKARYEVTPGSRGVLTVVPGRPAPRLGARVPALPRAGDGPSPEPTPRLRFEAAVAGKLLSRAVRIQGREPIIPLTDLAAALGLRARLDASGQWLLTGAPKPEAFLTFRSP